MGLLVVLGSPVEVDCTNALSRPIGLRVNMDKWREEVGVSSMSSVRSIERKRRKVVVVCTRRRITRGTCRFSDILRSDRSGTRYDCRAVDRYEASDRVVGTNYHCVEPPVEPDVTQSTLLD